MLNSFGQKRLVRGAVLALGLGLLLAPDAAARPKPGSKSGFRLFATAEYRIQVNRVNCRLQSNLGICSTGSSTVGGGTWPRGTADGYVFAGGVSIAGIIPGNIFPGAPATGDTTGASFFFETGDNGSEIIPINTSANSGDVANWPAEAFVPLGDSTANFYDPALRGLLQASQEDAYFLSWDGDPGSTSSRTHPLGVAVETRVLGWNFPVGNQDILYFLFTIYNVTSTRLADYATVRPALRTRLRDQGVAFRAGTGARFGATIPDSGYIIKDAFAAWISDMDVADANNNFGMVNVPFSLGYAYEAAFSEADARDNLGWTFDPTIFGVDPFFSGPGFVGTKFLGSPRNPVTNQQVGLTLFNTFSRSGNIQDPNDDHQLYRYMSGGFDPTADGLCSIGPPSSLVLQEKICFVQIASAEDIRYLQSSGPFDLIPGQAQTIALAMIYAAPVRNPPTCPSPACLVEPAASNADLTILGDATRMASGVNRIDSITGYLGFNDVNGNGRVTQGEFSVVPGSLLGKALVAQGVFDNKFLLPFAPAAPQFFLIPGDNQVTVVWQPSPTETVGDPFFAVASLVFVPDPTDPLAPAVCPQNAPSLGCIVNALYDPNFRKLDVEGYRVYRGRVSNPSELALVAQFDFFDSKFNDYRANVNPDGDCAPELGVYTTCTGLYDDPIPGPGVAWVNFVPKDITGTMTQITVPGNRLLTAAGKAQVVPGGLDTAFVELSRQNRRVGTGSFALSNTGIPYLFVDHGVRNSLRYFYSVTAFDVNSINSGPTSLESGRVTKPVIPVIQQTNLVSTQNVVFHVLGRGVPMDSVFPSPPTINSTTGIFSGPAQPANGGLVNFAGEFARAVLTAPGRLSMRLDSLIMGQADGSAIFGGADVGVPTQYWVTLTGASDSFKLMIPIDQGGLGAGSTGDASARRFFSAVTVKPSLVTRFLGTGAYNPNGQVDITVPGSIVLTGQGTGCRFGDIDEFGTGDCWYSGSRWFNGPSPANNETMPHPNAGNCTAVGNNPVCLTAEPNNAGRLTGVDTIQQAHGYSILGRGGRFQEWELSTVKRAADFNVFWNATTAGLVDSVIDVTHNVPVNFSPGFGATWGILNTAAGQAGEFDTRPGVLTFSDITCVEPFFSLTLDNPGNNLPCGTATAEALSNTAQLGPLAIYRANISSASATAPVTGNGFMFYLAGDLFLMQLKALPLPGTVWTLRSHTGHIHGGGGANGSAGDFGPYTFRPAIRPFTAVGATVAIIYSVKDTLLAATTNDLSKVHTVPDPYYGISRYEVSTENKILKFVGLPEQAIIRIYSTSGVLVRILEHNSTTYSPTLNSQGSEEDWDLRNRNNQVVASGVYFWHVEAGGARKTGRFTVITFAQ